MVEVHPRKAFLAAGTIIHLAPVNGTRAGVVHRFDALQNPALPGIGIENRNHNRSTAVDLGLTHVNSDQKSPGLIGL